MPNATSGVMRKSAAILLHFHFFSAIIIISRWSLVPARG